MLNIIHMLAYHAHTSHMATVTAIVIFILWS